MHSPRRSRLPSQPGPPVTSGCWSQFSTLPQAQSICWCFKRGGKVARDETREEEVEEKEGNEGGQNQRWTQNRTRESKKEGERKQNE